MKENTMFKKIGAISLAALFLTGCTSSPEVEEVPTYQENPTVKAFEDSEAEKAKETAQELETANLLKSSEGTLRDAGEIKRAHGYLKAAAFFVENNKTSDGYPEYLYYQTNSSESVQLLFVAYLSSPKSYCIQAVSKQDADFSILYDSQQKRVLKNGESCKPPLGTAWGAIATGDEETLETE